ncbi:MAG: hypothetical protein QY326_04325 [Bdellovibrionota bacterium]|nr:MAG: hypothetical protein QY326_04325 [Bdellovibrionota bacterium]
MFSILGAGFAYPEGEISNEILRTLGGVSPSGTITTRRTALKLDYLLTERNADPKRGSTAFVQTPTDLTLRAALMAIEQAGIARSQIGMIIGATDTPLQVTPGESQRLGDRLVEKIDAFDVSSGLTTLASQMHALLHWKVERMPEYVLCVAASAPTQRVDYRSGIAGSYLGDGAYAFVVSKRHQGFLRVVHAEQRRVSAAREGFVLPLYGHIRMDQGAPQVIEELIANVLERRATTENALLICNAFEPASIAPLALRFGMSDMGVAEDLALFGHCLCAFPGAVLAKRAAQLNRGVRVCIALADYEGLGGIVELERC